MGKLRVSYSVYKGEGELVLYAEHLLTALYRDPAPFADEARAADGREGGRPWLSLRGMTWDHARGYDPMVATSAAYAAAHPGVTITWEKRSLQAFADRPIGEMAETYDLMVIDHPHVGEVARAGQPSAAGRPARCRNGGAGGGVGRAVASVLRLRRAAMGAGHRHRDARGLPAARPAGARAPTLWDEVLDLARAGRVALR